MPSAPRMPAHRPPPAPSLSLVPARPGAAGAGRGRKPAGRRRLRALPERGGLAPGALRRPGVVAAPRPRTPGRAACWSVPQPGCTAWYAISLAEPGALRVEVRAPVGPACSRLRRAPRGRRTATCSGATRPPATVRARSSGCSAPATTTWCSRRSATCAGPLAYEVLASVTPSGPAFQLPAAPAARGPQRSSARRHGPEAWVSAEIVQVEGEAGRPLAVVLDAGSVDRLRAGQRGELIDEGQVIATFELVDVEERQSRGRLDAIPSEPSATRPARASACPSASGVLGRAPGQSRGRRQVAYHPESMRVRDLAASLDRPFEGDGAKRVERVGSLLAGGPDALGFLRSEKHAGRPASLAHRRGDRAGRGRDRRPARDPLRESRTPLRPGGRPAAPGRARRARRGRERPRRRERVRRPDRLRWAPHCSVGARARDRRRQRSAPGRHPV